MVVPGASWVPGGKSWASVMGVWGSTVPGACDRPSATPCVAMGSDSAGIGRAGADAAAGLELGSGRGPGTSGPMGGMRAVSGRGPAASPTPAGSGAVATGAAGVPGTLIGVTLSGCALGAPAPPSPPALSPSAGGCVVRGLCSTPVSAERGSRCPLVCENHRAGG